MAQVLRSLLWTGERDPALSKVKEVDLFISHLAMSNEEVELQGLPTLAVDAFGSSEMVRP